LEQGKWNRVGPASRHRHALAPAACDDARVPRVVRAFPRCTDASAPLRWTTSVVDPLPLAPSPAPRLGAPPRPAREPSQPRGAARRAAARTHACSRPRNALWPAHGRALVEVQACLGQINREAALAVALPSAVAALGVAAVVSFPPSQTDTSLASLALP
jgi:hypothetical protein